MEEYLEILGAGRVSGTLRPQDRLLKSGHDLSMRRVQLHHDRHFENFSGKVARASSVPSGPKTRQSEVRSP